MMKFNFFPQKLLVTMLAFKGGWRGKGEKEDQNRAEFGL